MMQKKRNDFTQFCCLKHYSLVCARKFEFLFHAIILYYGNVYSDKIYKCDELQLYRYDAKFRVVVDN